MPTSFWVMMGLGEPDGAYSVEDEREIMYRQTKEERQAYAQRSSAHAWRKRAQRGCLRF